jgi:glycerol-3-phosphate O-acyltransferase
VLGVAHALARSPPAGEIVAALRARLSRRLGSMEHAQAADLLADTYFYERRRLEKDDADETYRAAVDSAGPALRDADRAAIDRALLDLAGSYGHEIHHPFSERTYGFATRVMPGALGRLLTAAQPRDLLRRQFDAAERVRIEGPIELLRRLSETATLILAPTHVSNLDSPLIGYVLFAAGLPPFAYGAGLNLFGNPAMSFFMSRLGAYTVDRRKKNQLYKDTLKDYSVEILGRRHHSLFFPGGTRSRSGRLETKLKKGLLGTGLAAWQESLATGRDRGEIYVVPCTLSMALVLEAETLIADSLAEEGKQRYIITDDEFSEPRTVASFARSVLSMDAAVHVTFGRPMDLTGNEITDTGESLDPRGRPIDRRQYVTDASGAVVLDEQRDHAYTERLASRISAAYHRDFVVQSTHLAAWAAWRQLQAEHPGRDTWRLVRVPPDSRVVSRAAVVARIAQATVLLHARRRALPGTAQLVLDEALRRFASFHRARALDPVGGGLRVSPELCLYYKNRLSGFAELR